MPPLAALGKGADSNFRERQGAHRFACIVADVRREAEGARTDISPARRTAAWA